MTRFHTLLASMGLSLACSMALAGEITVSAASSLTNAFKEVAQGFEAQYPGSKVLLNFAASGALLQQLAKGAPGGAAGAVHGGKRVELRHRVSG